MKNKDFNKNINLSSFLEKNMLDFSFDQTKFADLFFNNSKYIEKTLKQISKDNLKKYKKIEKNNKKTSKLLENNNKNAKNASHKEVKNSKRIKKCNDQIIASNLDYKEIYLTIDKFNTNGKKTVVYFIDSFFPVIDGVVSVLDNYAVGMQKYYNVVICAPKHRQSGYKTDKYFVLYSDSIFIKNQGYDLAFPQLDAEFQKFISLLKIDLVHVQSPFNMGNFGVMLAKKRGVPCFATFHSQFKQNFQNALKNEAFSQFLTSILMNIYKRADVAITMNNFARGVMKEYGLKKNVEIIPNATNLVPKEFDKEYETEILNKFKVDPDKFNMIYIGRFVEVKNIYFILDILKELFKTNKEFNFIFLGYGPEQSKMQKFIRENGLQNNVIFTEKVDEITEKSILIKNSDLLVFPSIYDTDGIVRIECACYGVPTLCIEKTGVASTITNNHNGFIEINSVCAFASRIDYLIKNVDFLKKIGQNAKIEIYNTWEDVCRQLYELYEKNMEEYTAKKKQKLENKKRKNAGKL